MKKDTRQRIEPEEKVSLTLSEKERKLILEETEAHLGDEVLVKTIKRAKDGVVSINLTDWEELQEYVAAAVNHQKDKKVKRALDGIWDRIKAVVFDKYDDQE